MDVVLLRWPAEDARREHLRDIGGPRLLLVEDGRDPPAAVDCLEDWVWVAAPEKEVQARVDALALRDQLHQGNGEAGAIPVIDQHGVLRFHGAWLALPPLEARLMAALIERFGAVAGRDALLRAGWARQAPTRNALDVHVLRLRRRLAPMGLAIRTIRSRGYLLEPDAAGDHPST